MLKSDENKKRIQNGESMVGLNPEIGNMLMGWSFAKSCAFVYHIHYSLTWRELSVNTVKSPSCPVPVAIKKNVVQWMNTTSLK